MIITLEIKYNTACRWMRFIEFVEGKPWTEMFEKDRLRWKDMFDINFPEMYDMRIQWESLSKFDINVYSDEQKIRDYVSLFKYFHWNINTDEYYLEFKKKSIFNIVDENNVSADEYNFFNKK